MRTLADLKRRLREAVASKQQVLISIAPDDRRRPATTVVRVYRDSFAVNRDGIPSYLEFDAASCWAFSGEKAVKTMKLLTVTIEFLPVGQ